MPGPMGRKPEKIEKGTFKKSMGKLLVYCKKYWGAVIVALLCGIVGAIAQIIGPNKIKDLANEIMKAFCGQMNMDTVTGICVFLVVLYVCGAVFSYAQQFVMTTVTQRTVKSLRRDISRKINRLPLNYFDNHRYGDVLSRVTNDVDTIGESLGESIGILISNVVLFLGVLIMMFVTQPLMALTVVVATVIGFGISSIFLTKSQKYFNQTQENLGAINAHIEEVYSGHNVVSLFNAKKKVKQEFDIANKKMFQSGWKSQFISGIMMPLMGFVGNFGYVAVCVVGAILVTNNQTDIGTIAAFMIYVRLFSSPLTEIAQSMTSLQSASASCKRVFEFLENEEMSDESQKTTKLENVKGNVVFDHVTFGYNSDKLIIKDFSADIKAGQKVAIVGPTGAGKTTLVNLLMRFYEVNSGDITIDGVSIRDITRENLHSLFGMVLQDTWLFQGTIKENLRYNSKNVSDEQIVEVCKSVGLDHFIQTLPQGYDTVLDDSSSVSAGQKQLFTIARTMLENSPMIILDEATSSVDTRMEILIQNAMDKVMEKRTSFVIAHRLSTIKNADIIFVLKDGDIVEKGNHEELLKRGGFYAELYNSQFEEE